MHKSYKQRTQDGSSRRLLSPLESSQFTPEPSPLPRNLFQVVRKSSMIELPMQVKHKENRVLRRKEPPKSMASKKILQIVKEAQLQLHQQQPPLTRKQRTLETQFEGMNFTFAQNFSTSNKQILLKEFSAQSLRKKFFV